MKSFDPKILFLCLPLLCCSASPEAGNGKRVEAPAGSSVATFAGGCFWCMEKPFEQLDGVHSVVSGYAGGVEVEPTYQQVAGGRTGHAEAVQVHFDPQRISYAALLSVFWRQVDPTDAGGQFVDRGAQYRTTIWVHDAGQRAAAEASKAELEASSRFSAPIVTPIEDFTSFWPAEESHQDYYLKNPGPYLRYRRGSGRDRFLERVWADERAATSVESGTPPQARSAQTAPSATGSRFVKPSEAELRARLTPLQYRVTQEDGTEPPFKNLYWNNERAGIYVDIVSGEPLYSSAHAFKSGTGWPSFWRALVPSNVVRRTDRHLGYPRTELRSAAADSHLGHVFDDGPKPTGERHCINSAALRFVPVEQMEAEGYGEFLPLLRGE